MLRRRHRRQGRPADLGRRAADHAEGGLDRGRPLRAAVQAGRPQGRLQPERLLGLGAQLDHVALRLRPHARLRPGDRRVLAAVRQRQRLRGRRGRLHAQGRRLRRLVLLEVRRPRACRSGLCHVLRRRHRRQGRPADLGRRAADHAEGGLDRGRPLRAAVQAGRPQGRLQPERLLGLGAQLDHVALRLRPHARLRPGDRRVLAAVRQRQRLRGRRGRLHAQGRRLRRLVLLEVRRPRACRSGFRHDGDYWQKGRDGSALDEPVDPGVY